MTLEHVIQPIYSGVIKCHLISGLSAISFSDLAAKDIVRNCLDLVGTYFDLGPQRQDLIINVEVLSTQRLVHLYLHDRPIRGCEVILVRRNHLETLAEDLLQQLSPPQEA